MLAVSPRIPAAGPILISIPGITGIQIAAATDGAEVVYQWPFPYVVSGFWLGEEETANPIVLGAMRLRIVDEDASELVTDGRANVESLSALAVMGRSPRWQPFRRVVCPGRRWTFQILNENAGQTVTPQLYFRVEEE